MKYFIYAVITWIVLTVLFWLGGTGLEFAIVFASIFAFWVGLTTLIWEFLRRVKK